MNLSDVEDATAGTTIDGEERIIRNAPRGRQSSSSESQPRKQKSSFDTRIGQQQLQRALYSIFKAATIPLRSDAEFQEGEFQEASKDLIELVNRIFILRIFFNVIAPLAGVVTLKDKIQRLIQGRKKQPEPMYPPDTKSVYESVS